MRRSVLISGLALCLGFAALMVYLGYFYLLRAPRLQAHPLNPRTELTAATVHRGGILDRNGEILAQSVGNKRLYPLGSAASHVTGYLSRYHGSTGVEQAANGWLAGLMGTENALNRLRRLVGKPGRGYDVILTVDARLQQRASELLGGRRGAIVVLNPTTGEVLALVSSPAFDPEEVDSRWSELERRTDAPLLNRALNGLYPPGSVAKVLTAALALETDPALGSKRYPCPGYLVIEGRRLECPAAHGEVDLAQALVRSCNVTYARLALELGVERFRSVNYRWGFNRQLPFDLPVSKSRLPTERLSPNALAEIGIGQGRLVMTPFHIALVTAAIANQGMTVPPRLLSGVRLPGGGVTPVSSPAPPWPMFGSLAAAYLSRAMTAVVEEGTGRQARIPGLEVAGKTGTAENPHGPPHAWFTGFAPAGAPRVVATVLVENGGSGGTVAAPLARELLTFALSLTER
ncbi:MAG: peptidoglycan D,D-transpeptidase FtsI family protein [Moorellales bacterium]